MTEPGLGPRRPTMSTPECHTRCVVLMPRTGGGSDSHDAGLRSLLAGRGWSGSQSNDPIEAFAELCLAGRVLSSSDAWGSPGSVDPPDRGGAGEVLCLVVVEPARWRDLRQLVSAAARYVPNAGLYCYEGGVLGQLESGERAPQAGHGGGRPPAASGDSRPSEAGEHVPQGAGEPAARKGSDPVEPARISREEIEMLLNGDHRDGGS